jgi:hypothetical protein
MQYIYEDLYRGKIRKLLILTPHEGTDYRVFHDADFLGSIRPVKTGSDGMTWKTEYNILKPIVIKMGEYIESFG